MLSISPEEVSTSKLHAYLLHAVAPRPIAFASTIDSEGHPNLAPFSFFNVFSARPPILVFSPSRRVRDNTVKHTLENVQQIREVVINTVSYAMVQQVSLASTEYPKGVNEFVKAGFTMLPSERVKPYRVAESPVQLECVVKDSVALGSEGGAGNLVICEVVRMHIAEGVLDAGNAIDPRKIDLVSRMGGDWYCRSVLGMFEVPKPVSSIGMGVDALPRPVRESAVLTGNDLGKLGNVTQFPDAESVAWFVETQPDVQALSQTGHSPQLHRKVQEYLEKNELGAAWKLLLAAEPRN